MTTLISTEPSVTDDKVWTYTDFQELDDEHIYEILKGELTMAPAPSLGHQKVSRDLFSILWGHVQDQKMGEVYYAPVDVKLDDTNIFQPDLVFVAAKNAHLLKKAGIFGAPDVVIEIISPTSLQRDKYDKKEMCRRFDVKEFWLVDPANQAIEIFVLQDDDYKLHAIAGGGEGVVDSPVISGLTIDLSDVDWE